VKSRLVSAPDLRTLCHSAGGELEQIQFLLGHRSVETTERYLGSRQRLVQAVNDHIGIEPLDALVVSRLTSGGNPTDH
jgi:integrase